MRDSVPYYFKIQLRSSENKGPDFFTFDEEMSAGRLANDMHNGLLGKKLTLELLVQFEGGAR
ncbi:hypothetical protein AB4Z22_28420 [Paenibacillus sp. TAF58]